MEIVFRIGGINVYLFGLTLGAGLVAGCIVAFLEARRKGQEPSRILDLALYATLVSLVFSRLTYIFLEWGYYSAFPSEILKIHGGGFSFYGGLAGGILFIAAYSRKTGIDLRVLGDVLAPALALAYAIGRVGCDIFGRPTTVAWAVHVGVEYLHPAQAYSIIAGYSIFGILWSVRRRTTYDGQLMIGFLFLYGIARFVIEFFRSGEILWFLTLGQWVSLLMTVVAIALHSRWLRAPHRRTLLSGDDRAFRAAGDDRVPPHPAPGGGRRRFAGWLKWSVGLVLLLLAYWART